jgi:hypothetical protein
MQLYQFYLPDELPEFDSYRVTSISADVECLLKRIAALVPPHYKPGDIFSICTLFFRKENYLRKCLLFVIVTQCTVSATSLVLVKHSRNVMLLRVILQPYFLSSYLCCQHYSHSGISHGSIISSLHCST